MTDKIAIVFPGQGSQTLGMLADMVDQFPEIKTIFNRASVVLNYDLWELVQNGPVEKLNQTEYTQPALLAASYALWEILKSTTNAKPAMLAGHSLGEYTALVCAEAIKFEDAIQLVAARGRFMQEAVVEGEGAMAAIIGLDDATVAEVCKQAITSPNEILTPANFNSLGQVVIAGHKEPVTRAMTLAKEKGASMVILIPVSVPSHCALMNKAAERLKELLSSIPIQSPQLPVVNNADVTFYTTAESIRDGLVKQLFMPVRWVEIIQFFVSQDIKTIIECGPGKVLTGLNKRIDKTLSLTTAQAFIKEHEAS